LTRLAQKFYLTKATTKEKLFFGELLNQSTVALQDGTWQHGRLQ